MKAATELPNEKVAKLRVRSSAAPSEPMRLCTETWKKMWPRPMSAAQANNAGNPGAAAGIASAIDMVIPPHSMG